MMKDSDRKISEIKRLLNQKDYSGRSIYEVIQILGQKDLLGNFREDISKTVEKGILYKYKMACEGKLAAGYEGNADVFQARMMEYYINDLQMDEEKAKGLCRYVAVIAESLPLRVIGVNENHDWRSEGSSDAAAAPAQQVGESLDAAAAPARQSGKTQDAAAAPARQSGESLDAAAAPARQVGESLDAAAAPARQSGKTQDAAAMRSQQPGRPADEKNVHAKIKDWPSGRTDRPAHQPVNDSENIDTNAKEEKRKEDIYRLLSCFTVAAIIIATVIILFAVFWKLHKMTAFER